MFHCRRTALDIDVVGDGFLYHMVRNIAGGLIDLGLHRMTAEKFKSVLRGLDRRQLGATAPAKGLCLEQVFYSRKTWSGHSGSCRTMRCSHIRYEPDFISFFSCTGLPGNCIDTLLCAIIYRETIAMIYT